MSKREPRAGRCRLLPLALSGAIVAVTPAWAAAPSDEPGAFAMFAVMCVALGLYSIPAVVAFHRGHPNRWVILAVNFLFGGTGIGWIGALLWAASAIHRSPAGNNGGESGLNLFVNDPKTVRPDGSPTPPPAPQGASATDDIGSQLERLAALRERGLVDEEKYARLRRPLLDRAVA